MTDCINLNKVNIHLHETSKTPRYGVVIKPFPVFIKKFSLVMQILGKDGSRNFPLIRAAMITALL